MRSFLRVLGCALTIAAAVSYAGQYPFPQNMKHPYGTIIEYADTNVVKEHYQAWKKTSLKNFITLGRLMVVTVPV